MESGDQQLYTHVKGNTPKSSHTSSPSRDARGKSHSRYGHTAINRRIKEQTVGVKQLCSLSKPDVGEPNLAAGENEDGAEEASVAANASENDEDHEGDTGPPEITVGADTTVWRQPWDHMSKLRVSGDIIEMPWHSLINRLFPLPNANQTWKKNDYYVPITLLLNAISLAYARRTQRTELILGAVLNPDDTFHGDVHNSLLKPDVVLFWITPEDLSRYLGRLVAWDAHKGSTVKIPLPSFNLLVSPGEVKTTDRQAAIAQTKSYLNIIKRNRPDLAEIFGFSARAEGFQLWKLDPCECLCTREYKWVLYNHFVEYFQALYSQTPSKMLVLVPSAAEFYEFKPNEASYYVFPFIATSALGRMTWVGLGYSISANLCIIKLSWIDVKAWDEFEIYQAVHKDGWLPGVARHIEAGIALETPTRITWPEMKDAIKRQQRYIVLGSVGDPLNMCESVLDFLMVMHDILETLEMLHKTGVMHRDLSWTNILCNPQHHNQTEKQELEGEGIGKKLDLRDKSWRSLLVDFDHGLLDLNKDQRRAQRTGTPMFMATDLASSSPVDRKLNGSLLRPALQCITKSHYKTALLGLYKRVQDMATREEEEFQAVLEEEPEDQSSIESFEVADHRISPPHSLLHEAESRLKAKLEPDPPIEKLEVAKHYTPPPHSLLHEAESIFWITSFGLLRALPEGIEPKPGSGTRQVAYDTFFHTMLNHHIGDVTEQPGRESYKILAPTQWRDLLHPSLENLAPMLHAMGSYLAFAWDKIPNHGLGECHAYQVMKALLVVFIKKLLKSDPIKLNTSYPRPANPKDDNERRTLTSEYITTGQLMPIKSAKRGGEPQEDPRSPKKRKKSAVAGQVHEDEPEEPSYLKVVDFEGRDRQILSQVHTDVQRRQLNELKKRRWYMMSVRLKGGREGRAEGT